MMRSRINAIAQVVVFAASLAEAQTLYQPCPLLRAYYPSPTLDKSSSTLQSFTQEFTSLFDDLIANGGSDDFGAITPNTTSFSVVLFSGADSAQADPVLYEYYHTATLLDSVEDVTPHSLFPTGTLTQLFTIYAWLIESGSGSWDSPITDFLPELGSVDDLTSEFDVGIGVDWTTITIGSLAAHMSGLMRDCELPAILRFHLKSRSLILSN